MVAAEVRASCCIAWPARVAHGAACIGSAAWRWLHRLTLLDSREDAVRDDEVVEPHRTAAATPARRATPRPPATLGGVKLAPHVHEAGGRKNVCKAPLLVRGGTRHSGTPAIPRWSIGEAGEIFRSPAQISGFGCGVVASLSTYATHFCHSM